MLREGRERITGTLIGAFWGAVIVFSDLLPVGDSFRVSVVHYSLLGILTGLVIYSTVLLNIARYALFSAVVFLGISMYHLEDVNPYLHVFYRTLETIIGVGVAIVCQFFSPAQDPRPDDPVCFRNRPCPLPGRPPAVPLHNC
jgi:uncharacterized membrane protein YgaE (UPF0421/DUF939 family)